MVAIAAISLIVGGIGILNIVLATVMERTREIRIRRRSGRGGILISVEGGLAGIAFGIGLSWLIATVAEWKAIVTPLSVGWRSGYRFAWGYYLGLIRR